jgi:hypothetical protein
MKKLIILFSIAFIFNFCKKEEEVDDVPTVRLKSVADLKDSYDFLAIVMFSF